MSSTTLLRSSPLLRTVWAVSVVLTVAAWASAQTASKSKPAEAATEAAEAPAAEAPTTIIQENTLEACADGQDNDGDGHLDCADQDCQIYAICVQVPEAVPVEEAPVEMSPPEEEVEMLVSEMGRFCRDKIDNNGDGKIDCYEESCARSTYCKSIMYERPEAEDKVPGLFMSFGFGVALPNYRMPTMEAKWQTEEMALSDEYEKVPFDPDMGIMLDLQMGYMFLKFMGAGVSFKSAFTFASNRSLHFQTTDDPDKYKYTANKYYGNVSAFLRFQWPFKRLIPYVNLHVGYSVAQATWEIYDPANDWEDIDDAEYYDDDYYIVGESDEIRSSRNRHFTFALEPGLDLSVIRRLFTVGLKVWLPVIANKDSSNDNLGILLNFGFTPTWRERLRLKPEYADVDMPDAE